MYLNYSKIKSARREQPQLRLRTLAGKELGPIPYANNLHLTINYADTSEIEFQVPYQVDGLINPMYAAVSGYSVVYTDDLGIYVLTSPNREGDGVSEIKTVHGYSIEYMFSRKTLFLEEGTYNFYDRAKESESILGRIVELDPTWHIGYVAPRLIGCYRTFDQYENDALSFCYGDAMEKYRCAIVFDVYEKTINAYDAGEDTGPLPIYLSYENLLEKVHIDEITEDMCTKLHVFGSDDMSIRSVNPTGADYLINLDYFINRGDLDISPDGEKLSDKVRQWELDIAEKQPLYAAMTAARASVTAQKLAADAELTELKGIRDARIAEQSVIIQALSMETTEAGKAYQQGELDKKNLEIEAKKKEIKEQERKIEDLQKEIDNYAAEIKSTTEELSYASYFSENERKVLGQFLIEGNVEEETFVSSSLDTTASGTISKLSGEIKVSESDILKLDESKYARTIYMITGGTIEAKSVELSAKITRGTLSRQGDAYVLTASLGSVEYAGKKFESGLITVEGQLSSFTDNIATVNDQGVSEERGSTLSFQTANATTYFTVSTSQFQQYSVAMDLYDFGSEVLDDSAWPVYEFSVDSGNFLYHEKFEPFKDKLKLGKSVHLKMGSDGVMKAKIIGIELDFEDISNFRLVFSNRYRLKNSAEEIVDEVRSSSRTSRSFDAGKYIYNRSADKLTQVDAFMNGTLDAAKNTIQAANNLSVVINGGGIHVGGNSDYQMRIVDNMIAMTDDSWKTAKMAIGLFKMDGMDDDAEALWGVNAEMLAGQLMIGKNLIIQNPLVDDKGNTTGTMMFQVDATGAWLYNSRIVLQTDADKNGNNGGIIFIDPRYGIAAGGTKLLFDTDGTTVTPEFMDSYGGITFDGDGMPNNANFYLDSRNGNAYFRGKLMAESGQIGGFTIGGDKNGTYKSGYLHSGSGGSYVALNGGNDIYSEYAIWAGADSPASAPFWVKKNGDMCATSGTFTGKIQATSGTFSGELKSAKGTFAGTIQAEKYLDSAGNNMMDNGKFKNDYLQIKKLNVNNRFIVDEDGSVTIKGGSITWDATSFPVQSQFSSDRLNWHNTMQDNDKYRQDKKADGNWGNPYQFRGEDGKNGQDGDDGIVDYNQVNAILSNSYGITTTKIGEASIESPTITGNEVKANCAFRIQDCGYMGYAFGEKIFDYGGWQASEITYGVAMCAGTNILDGRGYISYNSDGSYVIATNAGVRMTFKSGNTNHSLTVTENGCYADNNKIGTSSAVWG